MIDTKVEKEVGQAKEEFHAQIATANKRIEGLVNKNKQRQGRTLSRCKRVEGWTQKCKTSDQRIGPCG
jgi:hypothetical protein